MKEVKVGIVGLGRLGSVHAENLAFKIPGCKLVAACSLVEKELEWAKEYLKVDFVTTDYKKMVDEADIEAVVIVSSSPEHCWMIEYALDAGKHVFCDKPLGCSPWRSASAPRPPWSGIRTSCSSWALCAAMTRPTPMPRHRSTRARSASPIW